LKPINTEGGSESSVKSSPEGSIFELLTGSDLIWLLQIWFWFQTNIGREGKPNTKGKVNSCHIY